MLDDALSLPTRRFVRPDAKPSGWAVSAAPVAYPDAVEAMERRVEAIAEGRAGELVWLLEHPPLYTAGVSAKDADLLAPDRFPVFRTGRGGQFTYHGPGQRVAYVMLDLRERGRDVKAFVRALEAWLIGALDDFNIEGQTREDRVGVWVERGPVQQKCEALLRPEQAPSSLARIPGGEPATTSPECALAGIPPREDKIAAIGVKLRRWVSFHGVSLNVEPDLSHFSGIVPCGIAEHGVTSLVQLGRPVGLDEADAALMASFERVFGPVEAAEPPI